MRKSIQVLFAVLVLVFAAVGAYWYGSPYLAAVRLVSAARSHDADTFNRYVDYPSLRANLKDQLAARLTQQLAAEHDDDSFAAFGTLIGVAIVNQAVDAMVTPDMVMRMMAEGKVEASAPNAAASRPRGKVDWEFERKGFDRVVVSFEDDDHDDDRDDDDELALVLQRSGFAQWKLVELRWPKKP